MANNNTTNGNSANTPNKPTSYQATKDLSHDYYAVRSKLGEEQAAWDEANRQKPIMEPDFKPDLTPKSNNSESQPASSSHINAVNSSHNNTEKVKNAEQSTEKIEKGTEKNNDNVTKHNTTEQPKRQVAQDKYSQVRSAAGEAQYEYEQMMKQRPGENPVQDKVDSMRVNYNTSTIISGGNNGEIKREKISLRPEAKQENHGLRQIDENTQIKSGNGLKTVSPEESVKKNVRVESGIHTMGGKTGLGYVSGQNDGGVYLTGSVITNYNGIFKDKALAEACGVKYDPNVQNRTLAITNGKAEKMTKQDIKSALLDKGYDEAKAENLAEQAYTAIHEGSASQGTTVVHNNNFNTSLINNNSKISKKDKVNILIHNDNVMIHKKMGHTKTDVGIKIERPMRKTARSTYHYATGLVEQGGGEAGAGVKQMQRGLMIASLALPSVGVRVNATFQTQLQMHLNGFVKIRAKNGTEAQLTISEAKHLLMESGFSASDLKNIRISEDFSRFAKNILSKNQANIKATGEPLLTAKQNTILQTFSKATGVTANDRERELRKVLNKYGVEVIHDRGHFANQRINAKIKQVIKQYGGEDKVPADLMSALKEMKVLKENQTYQDLPKRHPKMRKITMMAKSSAQKQGEAGRGISVTTKGITYVKNAVVMGVRATWASNMLIREAAQKALWLASKAALGAGKVTSFVGFKNTGDKIQSAGKKIGNASAKTKDFNRKLNKDVRGLKGEVNSRLQSLNDRFNPIAKAKRKVKAKIADFKSKLIKKNKVFAALSKVTQNFAKVFRAFGAVKALILKYLAIALGILLLLIVVFVSINSIVATIASAFNLNTQEYDTKQYLANNLKTYFEEDMAFITDLEDSYTDDDADTNPHANRVDHIYITYEDYKNYEKYQSMSEEYEAYDFVQSSNNGEIMSMASVKFDYNLGSLKDKWFSDDPKKDKQFKAVEEYMQQLYYGSHNLVVRVESQTFSSEDVVDGVQVDTEETWSYTVYTIYATYKTYYFDSLFDCQLLDSPQRTFSEASTVGQATGYAQSWDSIYYALRNHGFSHNGAAAIMSNMAHESGDPSSTNWHNTDPNPAITDQSFEGAGPYGICQWTSAGGRKAQLVAWCESNGFDFSSTSGQLAYMIHEIDDIAAYSATKSAVYSTSSSAYDIANVFGDNFEIYGGGQEASRGNLAEIIADYYSSELGGNVDDWSSLMSLGDRIAEIALASNGQIHYTQGTEGYEGTRVANGTTADAMTGFADRTNGTDCSGFVRLCYQEAGASGNPPYTTSSYPDSGWIPISQAVPGDIAWRSGHVGIVTGGGATMELHTCYFGSKGSCTLDCSPGSLSNFSRVYRYW